MAIKIAPFDRYATLDVVRAVADAGRDDIALYTGNDDSIVADLRHAVSRERRRRTRARAASSAGCWASGRCGRTRAVELLERVRAARGGRRGATPSWLREAAALTDANGAIFDAANGFAGCIPGIHEVLRRQGLLAAPGASTRTRRSRPARRRRSTA